MNRRAAFYGTMIVLSLQTLQSCFFNERLSKRKKANQCCSFDPQQNKLAMNCASEKVIFVRIAWESGDPVSGGKIFFESGFNPSVNEIVVPAIPDSIKNSKTIYIYLWNASQVIYDYSLQVHPEDWKIGKVVYGRYSYR